MEIQYCFNWIASDNRQYLPLTVAAAKKRYYKPLRSPKNRITAVFLRDDGIPEITMHIVETSNSVFVEFRNDVGSVDLTFIFNEEPGKKLFLQRVVEYTYPNAEDLYDISNSIKVISNHFRPDGYGKIVTNDSSKDEIEEIEFADVDVSDNWDVVPEFGDWSSLIRREERWTR